MPFIGVDAFPLSSFSPIHVYASKCHFVRNQSRWLESKLFYSLLLLFIDRRLSVPMAQFLLIRMLISVSFFHFQTVMFPFMKGSGLLGSKKEMRGFLTMRQNIENLSPFFFFMDKKKRESYYIFIIEIRLAMLSIIHANVVLVSKRKKK